jgi:hypothetical protein
MPDTPLRLGIAAALAFPDGSMTAAGLRREGGRRAGPLWPMPKGLANPLVRFEQGT